MRITQLMDLYQQQKDLSRLLEDLGNIFNQAEQESVDEFCDSRWELTVDDEVGPQTHRYSMGKLEFIEVTQALIKVYQERLDKIKRRLANIKIVEQETSPF